MDLIADILMTAGAIGAAAYCFVLSQRLKRLQNLDQGVGGAIAALSDRVDGMTRALDETHAAAAASSGTLRDLTTRAESVSRRLELLVAAMHDLPEADTGSGTDSAPGADTAPAPSTGFLSKRARINEGPP